MKKLLLIISFTGAFLCSYGQSYTAFIDAADEAFEGKDFYSALIYYQEALEFEKGGIDLNYKIAEAALGFRSYDKAEEYYNKVKEVDSDNLYEDVTYKLGRVQQLKGNYDDAKELYQMYLSENDGDDAYMSKVAQKEIKACEWAMEMASTAAESELYTIDQLSDAVNTRSSEFGAIATGDTLWFSSMRYKDKEDSHDPIRPYSYILNSINGDKGKRIDKSFKKDKKHIAHTTFNTANNMMYYTVCEFIVDATIRCDLYSREKLGNDEWGVERMLPINVPGKTSTQPSVGVHPETGMPALYFVSDRDGGEGGLDIWYSVMKDSTSFGEPLNLTSVNTIQDDITPFYHHKENILYFSSDGYQGLGGYDIYSVDHEKGWGKVEHLGPEINSRQHDIYYSVSEEPGVSYFSSDRDGSNYIDSKNKGCCFDIYKATENKLDLKLDLTTYNKQTLAALNGVNVRVINEDTGEVIYTDMHADDNAYMVELDRDVNYLIIADKPGFTSDTIPFNTLGLKKSETIVKKAYLAPDYIDLEVYVYDALTREDLDGATLVLRDLTDPTVEPITLKKLDSNVFNFHVKCGHTYQVTSTRQGYQKELLRWTIDDCESGKVKKSIYMTRNYLPTALYFDNDRPDRRTMKETTRQTYEQTYDRYYAKKERFKQIYSRRLSGQDKAAAENEMDAFFEHKVKRGMDQLNRMFGDLEEILADGLSIRLGIRGFASPLATNEYNQNLSKRRINSVLNQMTAYNNGSLKKYVDSGQLVLEEKPFGEETAPKEVSDSPADIRRSIYSVEASEERRVEIIEITINQED